MSATKDSLFQLQGGDVYLWPEQDSSVMIKAVSKHGDPVELEVDEALALAEKLIEFANKISQS